MDSPRTSRLRFLTPECEHVETPREWTPALVEVDVPAERWEEVRLWRQGEAFPIYVRRLGGEPRVLCDWPRSGTGRYRLRLEVSEWSEERLVTILPAKISPGSYARLLEDLESRLPISVAVGLQRTGAFSGVRFRPPAEATLAEELNRLGRAISGTAGRPGLAQVLAELTRDPHMILRSTELWVPRQKVRRPHPARLPQALSRRGNLALDRKPERVLDTRVEHTADVYENRLVKAYVHQAHLRLRRLVLALGRREHSQAPRTEAAALLARLIQARRQAAFLDEVQLLAHLPTRLTMVLLRRPPYRAAVEGYLEFRRSATVRLEEPNLDAPLENLPNLYQTWGTLEVLSVLLEVGAELGYRERSHQLVGRDAGGYYIRVLPGGRPALVLTHPEHGTVVKLIPERTYGSGAGHLHSVSFQQRPDVALEVVPPDGPPKLYLFDSKYKLDGEFIEGESPDGRPKKVDIDKMHAYRDAIRGEGEERVVRYAATLYPGPAVTYAEGLEALRAYPGHEQPVEEQIRQLLREALDPVRATAAT